jgi:predicted dehydrogenase
MGGSYGVERLIALRDDALQMGPPDAVDRTSTPLGPIKSWSLEWADFTRAIATKTRPCGDVIDALEALRVVDRVYGRL